MGSKGTVLWTNSPRLTVCKGLCASKVLHMALPAWSSPEAKRHLCHLESADTWLFMSNLTVCVSVLAHADHVSVILAMAIRDLVLDLSLVFGAVEMLCIPRWLA